ncbi:hypothetical protein L6164_030854 [Bauhinia variegata]|uniref:Uncharacterized protein n=1 Tax=Bauhinia variegata TaxID=167791 RepID=A0ACB9LEX7_BAUVA|nr:hypothetical protein L6164_030854 [Bauhinia variegata]
MELDIGVTPPDDSLESWFSSDPSSGYLEDAIAGWGIWCKHQNSPSYSQDQKNTHYLDDQVDLFSSCSSTTTQLLDGYCFQDCQKFNISREPSSEKDMYAATLKEDTPQRSWASRVSQEKGQWKKIAYPFELVKPGGVDGETTLKDINHQMLMSPSKPIPHPVGDSATHPCISDRGLGMSGKAVIALTRIQTQGRGSITIVRTKG